MRRRFFSLAALVFATACGVADDSSITEPSLARPLVPLASVASCPAGLTFPQVKQMLLDLYVDGSPDENAVRGKFDNLTSQWDQGHIAQAKAKAWDIAEFTLAARDAGKLPGISAQQIQDVLNAIFCIVGLGAPFSSNSFFIYPSDLAQTLISTDGWAGVQIPANNVTEPTLLTITQLTTPPTLDTKLDVYPLYYDFHIENEGGTGWLNPVVVGVCAPSNLDNDIKQNLLLGHQDGSTFELLPPADAGFLDCSNAPTYTPPANIVMNLTTGDSLVVSAEVIGSAGVGGSTDNFSPIAPVDDRVVGSAGAGGTVDNFRPRRGITTSSNLVALPSVSCSPIEAVIGTEVDPSCRPLITFTTPQGTVLSGIPVAWSIKTGGGSIANPPSCSPFQSSLSQNTDASGVTTVCWKLGSVPGTNEVVATGGAGGDAPLGVNFVYTDNGTLQDVTGIKFTATGIRIDPVVTANPVSSGYTGVGVVGNGSCSPNTLTAEYTYNTPGGTAPVAVGTYDYTVTCGVAGDPNDLYNTKTATSTITISQASSTVTVNCPTSPTYNGQPQTPCTASVTGAGGLNQSLTVSYSNNTGAGTATASASYAGDANHSSNTGSATFTINKAAATATAGSASVQLGAVVPTIPCTVTGLVAGDAGAVTCTTTTSGSSVAGSFPTIPNVSPANPPNYNVTLINGTLVVAGYTQVGCFSSPIFNVMPSTKSAQNKGSNLQLKCTLKWPDGTPVTNATGSVVVYDLGPNPLGTNPQPPAGAPQLSFPNAFKATSSGNYSFGLDTSVPFFVRGNAYFVRATWSDGSTTTGYFRIK